MLEYTIPSKRKTETKSTYVITKKEDAPWIDPKTAPAIFEALRRDKIIKDMANKCFWKPGDVVMPFSEEARQRFGRKCQVTAIARSLPDMGKDLEWPKDDQPLIVGVKVVGEDKHFFCTPGYLVKYVEPLTV